MAKAIKIIKCPSCGSSEKTRIKEDHYQCLNCDADYFLDNDDININVNYSENDSDHESQLLGKGSDKKRIESFVIISTAIFIAIIIFLAMLFPKNHQSQTEPLKTSSTPTSTNPPVSKATKPEITYRETIRGASAHNGCFISQQKSNFAIYRVDTYEKKSTDVYHSPLDTINLYQITKYDLVTKTKKRIGILGEVSRYTSANWEGASFENSDYYFIEDNKEVWRLNTETDQLENVTKTLLNDFPKYASGIASASPKYNARNNYNAIHILTNNGKTVYYFPDLDEVYEDNYDFQILKTGPVRDPETLKRVDKLTVQTGYTFASSNDRNNKLIKYQYQTSDGLPRTATYISEFEDKEGQKNYLLAHIFPSTPWDLIKDQNLTEGSYYNRPSVVYYDNDTLLIAARRTASEDSNRLLQRININNGDVLWSAEVKKNDNSPIKLAVIRDGNNFLITYPQYDCKDTFLINENGEIIDQYDLKTFSDAPQ